MESNFELFQFESRRCRRSFGVKIRGSKPEKPGFHLASCNMELLANYTKYYTVAIFVDSSLGIRAFYELPSICHDNQFRLLTDEIERVIYVQ